MVPSATASFLIAPEAELAMAVILAISATTVSLTSAPGAALACAASDAGLGLHMLLAFRLVFKLGYLLAYTTPVLRGIAPLFISPSRERVSPPGETLSPSRASVYAFFLASAAVLGKKPSFLILAVTMQWQWSRRLGSEWL